MNNDETLEKKEKIESNEKNKQSNNEGMIWETPHVKHL